MCLSRCLENRIKKSYLPPCFGVCFISLDEKSLVGADKNFCCNLDLLDLILWQSRQNGQHFIFSIARQLKPEQYAWQSHSSNCNRSILDLSEPKSNRCTNMHSIKHFNRDCALNNKLILSHCFWTKCCNIRLATIKHYMRFSG